MRPTTGATPLAALDAVAIDIEATSLDTARARAVELGAVEIAGARVFSTLVNPGIPLPPAASAVHGIVDADVAGAPAFAAAAAGLAGFVAGRVVIGHSVGYDLAVLQKEHGRAGLAWEKPRSLCLRLLGRLAGPPQGDASLEGLAAWLGVDIADRHRALGDARAAAAIFLALLPRLRERGIRTLGEAERASLAAPEELDVHARAGWSEPASRPSETASVLGSIDPYAYRHRVGDIMASPPIVVAADMPLAQAMAQMVARGVSSLLVSDDGAPGAAMPAYGIVTERDAVRRLSAPDGAAALGQPVGAIATRPVVSIRAAAYVYRALGRMSRLRIRHLAVRDARERLVGIVSVRDLLALRAAAAVNLDDAIEAAATPAEMAAAWALLPSVAEALLDEGLDARTVAGVISEEIQAMTRRAAMLAEAAMRAAGRGAPPCPFAVLVLGSVGRGESLLAADQDNAIVFAHGDVDGPEDRWFAELGARMAQILDAAGIPLCKGGVMASNAQWRGSVETWRARVAGWVSHSRPQDLMQVDIFFDLLPVHGTLALGHDLLDEACAAAEGRPAFAKLLGAALDATASPFTLLGRLRLDDGRVDIKAAGLFPTVAAARTLALRHGVRGRGTRERLDALIDRDLGGDDDLRGLRDGHAVLLAQLLAQQVRDLHSGLPVSSRLDVARLDRAQLAALKAALHQVQVAPTLVRDMMFGAG